jgi:hypothetical protein
VSKPLAHFIDVTRGADKRAGPTGSGGHDIWRRESDGIALRMSPSRRRLDIMSALTTGWLPWGVDWRDHRGGEPVSLPLCKREYILCCGHVLRTKEAQAFVDAGLLMDGGFEEGERGRPTLVITDAGKHWLTRNWTETRRPRKQPPATSSVTTDAQTRSTEPHNG